MTTSYEGNFNSISYTVDAVLASFPFNYFIESQAEM